MFKSTPPTATIAYRMLPIIKIIPTMKVMYFKRLHCYTQTRVH